MGIIGVIRLFTGFNGLLVVELSKGCRRLLKLLKPSRVVTGRLELLQHVRA